MAVDDINNTNPVLPAALQRRIQSFVPLAASLLTTVKDPVAVATAAAQNLTPAQQATLLTSEALQTLNLEPTSPIEPLLDTGTAPDLAAILESEGLSPAQQAALAASETVQAAIELENQTPAQQAALTVNQALQTLTAPLAAAETAITTETVEIAGQTPVPGPEETTPEAGTAAGAAPAGAAAVAAAAATPATVTATPAAATTLAPGVVLTPAQLAAAAARSIEFRNAVAVYEVRNPTPPPGEPAPIRKDLHPPVPIGRVRPVDPLVLRQEWEKRKKIKRKEAGRAEEIESRPPLAEKAIRDLVRQANEDLAASGAPLHLVLARNETGFALDIYDCSDDAVCEVTQEVSLDLNNLLTILDNLEHETGIIVNIKT